MQVNKQIWMRKFCRVSTCVREHVTYVPSASLGGAVPIENAVFWS